MIFPRGTRLPLPTEPLLRSIRTYQPAHNIGHFRYLECSQLDDHGQPKGEISNWDQVLFPFDPDLQNRQDLTAEPVRWLAEQHGLSIREEYTCDASGNLRVKISAEPTGYESEFSIGQLAKL
jgi:hypothetical protein